jgi:glucosamine-6-phosphate deaminase
MGDAAAADVAAKIKEIANEKGEVNMIFASAPSQNEFLAGLLADKDIPWEKVNTFHMDEYIGLDKDAPQGFGNFIRDRLWGKVNLKSANYLNGNAEDLKAECERYADFWPLIPLTSFVWVSAKTATWHLTTPVSQNSVTPKWLKW